MAEPVLDQPRVMASIGQGVAAGVAHHVSMDPEWQLGALANGLHEAVDGVSSKRAAALGLEDESTRRVALQLAQHAQFVAADGVDWRACRSWPCGRAAPGCGPPSPSATPHH